jgi:hypothetical protein
VGAVENQSSSAVSSMLKTAIPFGFMSAGADRKRPRSVQSKSGNLRNKKAARALRRAAFTCDCQLSGSVAVNQTSERRKSSRSAAFHHFEGRSTIPIGPPDA